MKRRKNETLKGNENPMQKPKTKRSKSHQNEENINPNVQISLATNDIHVKGIFNRFYGGLGNVPSQFSGLSPQTKPIPFVAASNSQESRGTLHNLILLSII